MPDDESCLYTLMHAPRDNHEGLLRDFVIPVVHELRDAPELDCLFFARYSVPDWQLRFRILGRPAWIDNIVKPRVDDALRPMRASGSVHDVEYASYQREWDRYGGERGMRLAERIFLYDSLACLELIDADDRRALAKSRREYSLLFVERFLDLMGFDRAERIAFYEFGHSWPITDGTWNDGDLHALDVKFASLEAGLIDLLSGDQSRDPNAQWGGAEPAGIAAGCLDACRPVVNEIVSRHRAGEISQDLVNLAWSYTHMHCNRLGVDAIPEAILRYFMWRLYTGTSFPA